MIKLAKMCNALNAIEDLKNNTTEGTALYKDLKYIETILTLEIKGLKVNKTIEHDNQREL